MDFSGPSNTSWKGEKSQALTYLEVLGNYKGSDKALEESGEDEHQCMGGGFLSIEAATLS